VAVHANGEPVAGDKLTKSIEIQSGADDTPLLEILNVMTIGFEVNEEFEPVQNKGVRGIKTMLNIYQTIADNQDKAALALA